MHEKTIVMYEISQKQQFIFRTNKLIENIGASHIIRELTTNPKNLFQSRTFKVLVHDAIQLPEPTYRIVGGGNATFIFDKKEDATLFARTLSFAILNYIPGIELFLTLRTIDWTNELLFDIGKQIGVINEMRVTLANKKNERKYAVKQESWGIQQACKASGLPANNIIEGEPRAKEFLFIKEFGKDTRNDKYYDRFITNNWLLSNNEKLELLQEKHLQQLFQENSTTDRKSYLAIISIDGNAMGVKVGKFFKQTFRNNEDFIKKYETFTKEIDDAYTHAFRKTIQYVMEQFPHWGEQFYGEEALDKWKYIVPIRPIIASGDDISFITYGPLGIEIAKIYLQFLQQQTITLGENDIKYTYRFEACAGVAIIRHKYPFWLGFEIADDLCNHAKKRLKNDEHKWLALGMGTEQEPYDTSLIDWQLITQADTLQHIDTYRKKYFQNEDQSTLIMRPYYIQHPSAKAKHFANYDASFKQVAIRAMQRTENKEKANDKQKKNTWIPAMSKWKSLRDVYHEGERAVNQWQILNQFSPSGHHDTKDRLFYRYKDGFGILHSNQEEDGLRIAAYYDAIEIFDYFIDLSRSDTQ